MRQGGKEVAKADRRGARPMMPVESPSQRDRDPVRGRAAVNVLVTGASGFLGSQLVQQGRRRGWRIHTTDVRGSVDFKGDLSDPAFCSALPDAEAVIHAAAVQYVSPDLPVTGRAAWFHRNNVLATRNLTQRYADRRTHFVNIGTSMMYQQSGADAYGVWSPMGNQGLYSASKIAAQAFVDAMANPTATVIPCIIGGRGRGGVFKGFVRTMTRFGLVAFPGRGRHKVHMVHVEDAAALALLIVVSRACGRFNCAGPEPISICDWVREIEVELGLDPVRIIRVPLAPVEAVARVLRYVPVAREQLLMLRFAHVLDSGESIALGWTPRFTNASIVRETARYLTQPP